MGRKKDKTPADKSEATDQHPPASFKHAFAKATSRDDGTGLKRLLVQGQKDGQLDENILRIGLQNCAKQGHEETAQMLLEAGAKTDITPGSKGSPALYWAISQPQIKGHLAVARLLLSSKDKFPACPADKNWKDEKQRSLVMIAAWRNHHDALKLLLEAGADINARDEDGKTVLHSLASDKKGKWDDRIVQTLLDHPVRINLRDNRSRTALHWACATTKDVFVEQLLARSNYACPNVDARTDRGKTALNLACSTPRPFDEEKQLAIVEKLLSAGADPLAKSDGGWTCLHVSTVIQNSVPIVKTLLLHCPSLLDEQTSTGLTALHCAAEAGSQDVVELLLARPDTQLNAKDAFYTTPLLRAAQQGHRSIVEKLAPFNNEDRLSSYAVQACNAFEATVVDFRGAASDHQNIVQKRSVYQVLYGKDLDGDHSVSTRVDKLKSRTKQQAGAGADRASKPRFRWIHLPANNLAWVEALLAKAFVEGDCSDLDGFKAIERSFSHQHKGPKVHSQFMTPLCQRAGRGAASDKLPLYGALEDAIKTSTGRTRHDYQSSPERARPTSKWPSRRRGDGDPDKQRPWEHRPVEVPTVHSQMSATGALRALTEEPEDFTSIRGDCDGAARVPASARQHFVPFPMPTDSLDISSDTRNTPSPQGKKKRRKGTGQTLPGTDEENGGQASSSTPLTAATRVNSAAASDVSAASALSNKSKKQAVDSLAGSNIVLFMPYLHWETDEGQRRMRKAVQHAQSEHDPTIKLKLSHDEVLIRAHLKSSLHLRRTLDQFYLHGIDTEARDQDQVVSRFCEGNNKVKKLYMVDQLFLFILGPGLIVTAFPQRWGQPKNDPLNVLDGIIEDVNSKTGSAVQSVYDLALLITARVSGSFDRHRPGDHEFQFLDMFESSIGNVNHLETELWTEFYDASNRVHDWISSHREPSSEADYPHVVDKFLNIGSETRLLREVKDIRDELTMISMVLNNQKSVLPSICDAICEDLQEARSHAKMREVKRKVEDQKRTVDMHLAEIERQGRLAKGIEASLLNLLDLKQKQSNAFEARFARDQAAGTVKQGQIIMVFTMVTIVFLPMSFMAAFFTIPINEFPRSSDSGQPLLHLSYVSKYTFGIGLGVSVILVALAFSINPITAVTHRINFQKLRKQRRLKGSTAHPYLHPVTSGKTLTQVGRPSLESYRKSVDVREMELRAPTHRSSRSISLMRRPGYANDIERG